MLACIQTRQNLSSQRLACTPKSLDVLPPPLLLPVPPLQPCAPKGKSASMLSRYPSPAELDAFAQKTANNPLSIKIFPSDIRVPQHKQLNKTVNGLDTTGQRYSPYSHSGGYQGLLAVVKASVALRGVVKNSDGKRTKHAYTQTSMAPYNNSLNNGYTVTKREHKTYHIGSYQPPDAPIETLCSTTAMASGDQSVVHQSKLVDVQGLMRQINRVSNSQALQLGGEARPSPSLQAVAAVAHADFVPEVPPHSSQATSGAVLPTQSADRPGYLENGDYMMWQHRHYRQIKQQQQQQQTYEQGTLRIYSVRNSAQGVRQSALACTSQPLYQPHPPTVGTGQEWVSGSSMTCAAMQGQLSIGQYFVPMWDSVVATPNSDCYPSQVLAKGTCAIRPRDTGLSHLIPHPNLHHHHPQLHALPHSQAYNTAEQTLCCGPPSSSLCHAAALSSSLQSLECLISEIQPPCIKERMLGHGYDAMGMPQVLEHHQQTHIQAPVYR